MGVNTNKDISPAVSRERVNLLKVPIDIVAPDQLASVIYDLLKEDKGHNIVLLSLWDLLRARRNNDYRTYVLRASLVIPISKSMIGGIKFLTGKTAFRYMPFDFIISLLNILEARELSCYLLGSKPKILQKTEKNLKQTFPGLRIVGRFPGYFKRQDEATIIQAIKKAAPALLLAGKGIRGEERWIYKNNLSLGTSGLRLWCSDIFDVFAEKKKHPSKKAFKYGLEWISYCFQKPYKFLRIFPFIYYNFLLLIYRQFRLN